MLRKILAAVAIAAGLAAVALVSGAQAAAPATAPVQTDYTECVGRAGPNALLGGGGGYITCTHDSPVAAQNAAAFAQLISPSGGQLNLPANTRLLRFEYAGVNNPNTPQDDRTIVGSTWRWFGHRVRTETGNGNTRLLEYDGPIRFYIRTTGLTGYCDANPCS
jgi:hypothetical protein